MTADAAAAETRSPIDIADRFATDASLAHAVGVGLFEVIDRFRHSDPRDPIPAPGIDGLPAEIHRHAIATLHHAAFVHLLASADDGGAARATELHDALQRTGDACHATQRGVRRLAQIGLGVAQHAAHTDEVELLERAMVGLLFHDDADWPAAGDEIPVVGRTRSEVSVELAGLLARLVIETDRDHATAVRFAVRAPGADDVDVTVHPDGAITVDDAAFGAPVAIIVATSAIITRVAAVDPTVLDRLTIRWDGL